MTSDRWRRLARGAALVLAVAYGAPLVIDAVMRFTGGERQPGLSLVGVLALALPYVGVVLALPAREQGVHHRVGAILALLLVLASPLLILFGSACYPGSLQAWAALLGVVGHVVMAAGGVGILSAEMVGRRRSLLVGLGVGALLVGVTVVGLVAALRVMSYRSPYQKASGHIRSMISAQVAWEATTGSYGLPTCLQSPIKCLPEGSGYPPETVFLDDARAVRDGYLFSLHVVPAVDAQDGLQGALQDYVIVAVPLEPAEGERYPLCGDASGVWVIRDGSPPRPVNGRCPPDSILWGGGGTRAEVRD